MEYPDLGHRNEVGEQRVALAPEPWNTMMRESNPTRGSRAMRVASLAAAAALLIVSVGCKKNGSSDSLPGPANPYRDAIKEKILPDGLVLEEVDLNNDGRPEMFNHYRTRADAPRLLVRKDADLNSDGRVDVRSWYDEAGLLELEEFDGDFDGQIDLWDHYQDTNGDGISERVSSEVDTDYDGAPNIFTYYRDGQPVRKERDTNGDGKIDQWEKFDSEGNVVKSGRDTDYDGSVDERD
jgi:hypothetical protein